MCKIKVNLLLWYREIDGGILTTIFIQKGDSDIRLNANIGVKFCFITYKTILWIKRITKRVHIQYRISLKVFW